MRHAIGQAQSVLIPPSCAGRQGYSCVLPPFSCNLPRQRLDIKQGRCSMRLVLFEGPGAGRGVRPGVLTEAGVVDVSSATAALVAHSPQHLMEQIIDGFETFRPAYERLAASALPVPLDVVLRDAPRRPGMEQDGG